VEVGVGVEHSTVRVSVRDSGAGIAPEFLPHVFEPFRQGERAAGGRPHGLGLGLAIVKHVVELHGGRVEAHSAGAGRGATFAVVLPVAERVDVKRENPGIGIPGLGVV
jgi:signal transduction histidine kinase